MNKCIVCNEEATLSIWPNYFICEACIKKIDFTSLFILYHNEGEDAVIHALEKTENRRIQ